MIDTTKVRDQIQLFKKLIAPNQNQKDALDLATRETMQKLVMEAKDKNHPLERVLLVALCGEIGTKQQQAEFASRLILLDILLQH